MPLRATLSCDKFRGGPTTTLKATSLTRDAVFRPLPAVVEHPPIPARRTRRRDGVAIGSQVAEGGGALRLTDRHVGARHAPQSWRIA